MGFSKLLMIAMDLSNRNFDPISNLKIHKIVNKKIKNLSNKIILIQKKFKNSLILKMSLIFVTNKFKIKTRILIKSLPLKTQSCNL